MKHMIDKVSWFIGQQKSVAPCKNQPILSADKNR